MYIKLRSVLVVLAVSACYVYGHPYDPGRQVKSENALIISWVPFSEDPTKPHISISDHLGHEITSLNVLQPVPEASRVSIYDVSARGNVIAVAAVYKSKEGNQSVRPTASLMLFDFKGQLVSAFALEPSHQIRLLTLDENSNIWTLTTHADRGVDPSSVPMLVEYSSKGKIVREMLTRSMFPLHAFDAKETPETGAAAMGCSSGIVWFWLPGSTDYVTVSIADGKTAIMKTQLPKISGRTVVPLGVGREASGDMVVNVREDDDQHRTDVKPETGYYRWSSLSDTWSQFRPGVCESSRLIGVGDVGGGQVGHVYMREAVDHLDLCMFKSQ